MLSPRNGWVLARVIEQKERKVGLITVPTGNDLFDEAEILAVGPGTVAAEGGRSETFDLKVGQRVFVKSKAKSMGPVGPQNEWLGVPYLRDGDKESYYLFPESSILGIIAEPV